MRGVWWLIMLGALVVGWFFILSQNKFHMTPPTIIVCLAYLAVVLTVANLWRVGAAAVAPEDATADAWERPIGARGELEKEKKTLLKAIKEAEFDLAMGKLSKSDADQMIATYRARAIAVIKELDRIDAAESAEGRRAQINREVAARVAVLGASKPAKKKAKAAKKAEAAEPKAEPKIDEATGKRADFAPPPSVANTEAEENESEEESSEAAT